MARIEGLPLEWLTSQTDLEILRGRVDDLPVSDRAEVWNDISSFAAEMAEGDELWGYSNGDEAWAKKCGTAGLAIVRAGRIVSALQLIMN